MKKIALVLCLLSSASLAGPREEMTEKVTGKRLELAQTLIEAFDKNFVCDADAYPTQINELVSTAWYNASEKQKENFRAGVSPGSEMRDDMAFRVATQQVSLFERDQSAEKFAASITGTKFYKFGQGAFGSPYNVKLEANGVAKENTLELLDNEPWFRWVPSTTTWSVRKEKGGEWNNERFVLRIGSQDFLIRQQESGAIWWQPVEMEGKEEIDYSRTLSSTDSYCEA